MLIFMYTIYLLKKKTFFLLLYIHANEVTIQFDIYIFWRLNYTIWLNMTKTHSTINFSI